MTSRYLNNTKFSESTSMRGILRYTVFKNGEPIERFYDNNLILFGTRMRLAHLVAGDESWINFERIISGLHVDRIAVGTNGNIPTGNDTEITDPFIKTFDSFDFPGIGEVCFKWKLLNSEANGKAIREFGLLTIDDTLFARRFRSTPINKESDISIEGDWSIAFG